MFDLTGMNALVTGASGGIGSAICAALASQGARLAVSGSNVDKLNAYRDTLGGDHVAIPCNLGDTESVEALVPSALEALGKIDILINNAGITRDNLAMRMKDEEWSDVIRINLESNFRLCRAAARPMMKARFGRIISITSVVGATGNPGQANYAASKAGVVGMSKALAQELASRHHGKLHRARFYRHADDGRFARRTKRSAECTYPNGPHGRRQRHWCCRRLSGVKRSGLYDRTNVACERRHGDVVIA